jgi:hypothetical protein
MISRVVVLAGVESPARCVSVLVGVVAMLMLSTPGRAQTEVPVSGARAKLLLDRAFRNLYADDYVQSLELISQQRGGRGVRRRLQVIRKQSIRPGKALIRFLEPYDIRHTSILILENEGENDDLWVYLPALRLTRRLSAAQRADSFFGTDLAYEDVEPKRSEDYVARPLSQDASDPDCTAIRIEPRAGIESSYERMIACIDEKRAVIRWMEFYRNGNVVKRLEAIAESIRAVDHHFIPFEMVFTTPRTQSTTRVLTDRYEIHEAIPDALFSTWNLEVGDAARDRRLSGRPQGAVE